MVVHSAVVQSLIMSKVGGAWDKLEGYNDWEALVDTFNQRAEEQEIPAVSAFQSCFVSMQWAVHDFNLEMIDSVHERKQPGLHMSNRRVGMRAENVVRVLLIMVIRH